MYVKITATIFLLFPMNNNKSFTVNCFLHHDLVEEEIINNGEIV